ncbi:MAG: galactosyldiacylglycerol synthase [Verrucomicrobiae bacterium]|nr:galactosyldiacylglycerol synthase [Verrucomicrobiae bacterium]
MKRILILTAAFGEGHNAAARNLQAAFEHLYPNQVQVIVHDLFANCYGFLNDATRNAYLSIVNYLPQVWDVLYYWLDRSATLQNFTASPGIMRSAFKKILNAFQPDLIISVYPTYPILLRDCLNSKPLPFLNVAIVTDSITVNSIWHRTPCDYFFVPNSLTADLLQRRGVKIESLQALGFPVSLVFSQLQNLEPPSEKKRLLFMINSRHRQALQVVQKLLQHDHLEMTITCGKHSSLRKSFQKLCERHDNRCQILGWTPEIPRLLRTHHVVLSKAGGATTQEAIAAQCPMIVNQVVPGQEEGNFELLRRYDAGYFAAQPETISQCVNEIFANRAQRWQELRQNISRLSRPRASLDIAEFLWEKLQSR